LNDAKDLQIGAPKTPNDAIQTVLPRISNPAATRTAKTAEKADERFLLMP